MARDWFDLKHSEQKGSQLWSLRKPDDGILARTGKTHKLSDRVATQVRDPHVSAGVDRDSECFKQRCIGRPPCVWRERFSRSARSGTGKFTERRAAEVCHPHIASPVDCQPNGMQDASSAESRRDYSVACRGDLADTVSVEIRRPDVTALIDRQPLWAGAAVDVDELRAICRDAGDKVT